MHNQVAWFPLGNYIRLAMNRPASRPSVCAMLMLCPGKEVDTAYSS